MILGSGFAVFVGLALGCAPKPATPPPAAAETAPAPAPAPVKSDVADDRVDLAQLNQIVEDWHKAWKSNNKAAEKNADNRLMRWINQELAEDRTQTQEAKQEAAGSTHAGTPKAGADDRQDAEKMQKEAERTRNIATRLKNMQGAFTKGTATEVQYQKKSDLLRQLQKIAQRELERSRQEQAEDTGQGKSGGKANAGSSSGGKQSTTSSSGGGGKKQTASGSSGGGGKQSSSSSSQSAEKIGPKKLVAAINKWLNGRKNKTPKTVKDADKQIKLWWQQELARSKPWTPRSKEIAMKLKKMQPSFNKNEATAAQWQKKKELLIELRKIANARIK